MTEDERSADYDETCGGCVAGVDPFHTHGSRPASGASHADGGELVTGHDCDAWLAYGRESQQVCPCGHYAASHSFDVCLRCGVEPPGFPYFDVAWMLRLTDRMRRIPAFRLAYRQVKNGHRGGSVAVKPALRGRRHGW